MKYDVISPEFQEFVRNIKNYFEADESETVFKQRNTIKALEFKDKKYAVKSFKVPHLLNRFIYKFFRDSKAKRSYTNSVRLEELGVNTPSPIGYVEFSTLFLFGESYYISEFFDYDFELRELVDNDRFENREAIIREFISFSYDLHNKGVYHVDYSSGNIIIKVVEGRYAFYLIDVNRMEFKELDTDLRMKNLAKLSPHADFNAIMVDEYAKISGLSKEMLQKKLDYYLDKQQEYLQRKRRLKQLKKSLFS